MISKKLILLLLGIVLIFSSTGKFVRAAEEEAADTPELDGEDDEEYDDDIGEMDKEEEIKLHKEEFDAMDSNADGKLDLSELSVAAKDEDIDESEITEFVKELDKDEDNAVSWDEYVDGLFNQDFEEYADDDEEAEEEEEN